MPQFLIRFISMFFSIFVVLTVFSVLTGYLLYGFSIYFLAKRQSLNRPWLAFVPIARFWMAGLLCDDAAARLNKRYSMRIWLPIISSVGAIGNILNLAVIHVVMQMFRLTPEMILHNGAFPSELAEVLTRHTGSILLLEIPIILCSLFQMARTVLEFVAAWPVFKLHSDQNATLYLVLSIVVQLLTNIPLLYIFLLCIGCKASKQQPLMPIKLR